MIRSRTSLICLLLAVLAVAVSACGGDGGSGSVSVGDDLVAVVGDREITVEQLDRQIELRVNAAEVDGQNTPEPGTDAYRQQVVQPVVDALVFNAQVENIAADLGIEVTDEQITQSLDEAIKQTFNGDQAKYEEYLKKYGLSDDEVRAMLVRPRLLGEKVQEKLTGQFQVTDEQVQKQYDQHKDQYTTQDSREVEFLLVGSRQDAIDARAQLYSGKDWKKVAKQYAIEPGPPQTGGDFTATKGAVEQNFGDAVFGQLATGELSALIPVSDAYAQSSLQGRCKPTCFFLVRPKADVVAGKQQTLDEVSAQIKAQLEQDSQGKVQEKIQTLLDEQKKTTSYNSQYKPPDLTPPDTAGGGSTAP